MRTIEELDSCFRQLSSRLRQALPDGIELVNLETLSSLNLLAEKTNPPRQVPWHYFHVHDSGDRITLYNDRFIAWIIPESEHEEPSTLVIIAKDDQTGIHPEVGFLTKGPYNSSKTVLRILERYIDDIDENETCIQKLDSAPS